MIWSTLLWRKNEAGSWSLRAQRLDTLLGAGGVWMDGEGPYDLVEQPM